MPDGNSLCRPDRRTLLAGIVANAAVVAATAGHAFAEVGLDALLAPKDIEISAQPITHFDRSRPTQKRFGQLEFRGGLVLRSPSLEFGGWSALVMAPDGRSLLAISDEGSWLTADLGYQGGRPSQLTRARLGPLLSDSGNPLRSKMDKDAEAVTLLDGTLTNGTLLIGFERRHRIVRVPIRNGILQAPTDRLRLPLETARMRPNQGIEAVVAVKTGHLKGSVVAFAERLTGGSGYHTGWVWAPGSANPQRFQLKDIGEFNITDTAALPNGDLLVLERRFKWTEGVQMRLRRLAGKEVVPNARLSGQLLLEVDGAYEIDNMEGLSVHGNAGGEIILTMISDDNFNHLLQRTLLLQFKILDEGPRSAARLPQP